MEIVVRDLCKSFHGTVVLDHVSFTAGPGVTCLMAPSGSGKTTLLRVLLGLERAESGTVRPGRECRWAAVFQEDRLLEQLDAMGNLRFALGPALELAEGAALLAALGLESGGKPVREYSGGMKRRLALCRALLADADALALDEPFAGLDAENRERAWRCIVSRAASRPVLLVTHEPPPAAGVPVIGL